MKDQEEDISRANAVFREFEIYKRDLRSRGEVNAGGAHRQFAWDFALANLERNFGENWEVALNSAADSSLAAKTVFTNYRSILAEAFATNDITAVNDANEAIKLFKSREKIPQLVGYFAQRTPAARAEYLEKNSPSTLGRDVVEKIAEPLKPAWKIANFLDKNLSTTSKVVLGVAAAAAVATIVFTGLSLAPFLASPLGVALTVGMKGFGVVKAALDLGKELLSLPKSITNGYGDKTPLDNFKGFPLTQNAETAWKKAQEEANSIEDPAQRANSLAVARAKCGKQSHAEITKELKSVFEDPNPSMRETMRWRLMLSDQSPEQLRDIVNIIKEKKQSRTVNKFALEDAIAEKMETDADFASKASTGFIGIKIAVKAAAAAAPFVVPGMLGEFGEHKLVEMGVDVASYAAGQFIGRKLEERRKESVLNEATHQSLPSSRHAPA